MDRHLQPDYHISATLLAGTIQDIVTRWAHQSGFHVERRFGWDTHGLPVSTEIDKTMGIKGPEDVAKMEFALTISTAGPL